MLKAKTEKPRGVLNAAKGQRKFHVNLYWPSQALTSLVEHYWIVSWDLRGQDTYMSEILPHPSVHLVFEQDKSTIFGVMTAKFSRRLEGKGRVIGIKFKPGAFYPFIKSPVSEFTDNSISISDVFDIDSSVLEKTIFSLEDEWEMVEMAENLLYERLPVCDENLAFINQIIECISANRGITKVDHIVTQVGLNKRTLQRLFNQYVGVGPKWVIKRYRLHEAAEQLASGEALESSRIALELGYFDQAHFIKDFKAMIGKTPAEYARNSTNSSL